MQAYLLSESGAPKRLIRLSNALLGWLPGGLSVIALVTCAVFTALTGATGLTIIALGGILLPAMMQERYSENFSLGLLTTSGTLGLLFPPSLPLIIYAIVAKVRIDHLFIAGIAALRRFTAVHRDFAACAGHHHLSAVVESGVDRLIIVVHRRVRRER